MSGYIPREAAIKALCERSEPCFTKNGEPTFKGDYIGAIASIPAADVVEARNGKWIEENTRPRSSQFCCSVCHRTAYDPQPTRVKDWKKRCRYAYCPNCGADMREADT